MRKFVVRLCSFLLSAVLLFTQLPFLVTASTVLANNNGEVVVVFKPSEAKTLNLSNASIVKTVAFNSDLVVSLVRSDVYSTEKLINILGRKKNVKSVFENFEINTTETSDEYEDYQWYLDNNDGFNGGSENEDINISKVWDTGKTSGDKVVAVVDTGIDLKHEDLVNNLWVNTYQRDLAGEHGYDFVNNDTVPQDDEGHGTHCAGVISAAHNNVGIKGVNSSVKLMAVKCLDENGSGMFYDLIMGYQYIYRAMCLGVNVVAINNSWGGVTTDKTVMAILKELFDLLGKKGAVSVCAAGNDSTDNDAQLNMGYYPFPDCVESDYVISVAASNTKGELSKYSSYGKNTVDIAAPGDSILSTVPYINYLPSIYSGEKNAEVTQYYTNFEDQNDFGDEQIDYGFNWMSTADNESITVERDTEAFFGNKTQDSASLKINVDDAQEGDTYIFFVPYTQKERTKSDKQTYISCNFSVDVDVASESDSSIDSEFYLSEGDYTNGISSDMLDGMLFLSTPRRKGSDRWSTFSGCTDAVIKAGATRALAFVLVANEDGDFTIHLDNIGISNAIDDNDIKQAFGKYDFMNGTSMATAIVTGAVALLAGCYPSYNTEKLIATVMGLATPKDSLKDKVRTGGIIDFSNINNLAPAITKATGKNGVITINGYYFGAQKGKVYIDGNEVNSTWNDTAITVKSANYNNKTAEIKVVNAKGKSCFKSLYIWDYAKSYTSFNKLASEYNYDCITNDGTNIYLYSNENESLAKISLSSNKLKINSDLDTPNLASMFNGIRVTDIDEVVFSLDNLVYYNGKIWGIAKMDLNYTSYSKLVSYNVSKDNWMLEAELPNDIEARQYANSSLALYKGKLYLIGGYDPVNNKASTMFRSFNESAKTWSNAGKLPSGRFNSIAKQVGNNLVVIYGGDGSDKVPNTLVYNGTSWSVKSKPIVSNSQIKYVDSDYSSGQYYTANVGITNNGLVITSDKCEGLGDTYFYNIATDKFSCSNYSLKPNYEEQVLATSIGGKFVALTFEYNDNVYNNDELIYNIISKYIPISSGNYKITKSEKNCTISGKTEYLPGDRGSISVKPSKNCYFTSLAIDGAKKSGKSYSFIASKSFKATATCGAYVTKIKLNKKSVTVKAGKKVKLKATVTPKKATYKKVKWTTGNKRYATVTQKGVVKTKKAGRGKTVKIYAKAMDGSKKKAYCKIKIKK